MINKLVIPAVQVGSENYMKSASYILEELEKIASNAGDHLRVEIDEQHVSGSFWMNILTHNMVRWPIIIQERQF